jgi:sugar/nucleoside kinase (ribokinase family)
MGRGPGPLEHGPRLVSVGSIVADIRLDVPHLPARGGDVIGSAATVTAGGGFNILAAAARQGMPALFAGAHGTGPYGDRIRAGIAREGITSAGARPR